MAKKMAQKGIFCIETTSWRDSWGETNEKRTSHSKLILRVLEISHGHFDVVTEKEYEYYLDAWREKETRQRFPVLLLSLHSDVYSSFYYDEEELILDDLVGHSSDDAFNKAIIHISSLEPIEPDKIENLLKKTGALSVSGYTTKRGINWNKSLAFELLFLAELFKPNPPGTSLRMQGFINRYAGKNNKELEALGRVLGFHLCYRVDEDNNKTDKHPDYITPVPCY